MPDADATSSPQPTDAEQREVAIAYEQLQGDLETLHRLVFTHNTPVRDSDIRASVNILRRWLCDRQLSSLCNKLGVKPSFHVEDNAAQVAAVDADDSITYFLTGGVKFDGRPIWRIYDSTNSPGPAPLVPMTPPQYEWVKFSRFVDQKRIYFEGDWITYEEIITFTANKLGGVHLDFRRNDRQRMLERASSYMTYGGHPDRIVTGTLGEVHLALEPNGTEVLSGFHFEVIAAATTLMQVRLDDQPLLQFTVKKSPASWLREKLGIRRRPKHQLFTRE